VGRPTSSKEILTLAGPLLAFSGAALFAGSVAHPHNLSVPKIGPRLRRWSWLTVVRVSYFLLIVAFTVVEPLAIVAALSALSAPSFHPIQLAVLYGYRSGVVNAAVRWGWVLAPFGWGWPPCIRWWHRSDLTRPDRGLHGSTPWDEAVTQLRLLERPMDL
jgi:hypothetical protein